MSDRLVIEIDGDASGLSKALKDVQARLTTFNTNIKNGNKALTGFTSHLNTSAGALTRLATGVTTLKGTLTNFGKTVNTVGAGLGRLGTQARKSQGDLRAFSTQLGSTARRIDALGTAARGAGTSLSSLQRRSASLGATTTALNASMRAFIKVLTTATTALGSTAAGAGKAAAATEAAGVAANRASTGFARLNRTQVGLAEGFRRNVAQLTALRTLTYQGLFWFSPLIYSIIKTNAAYEKQMMLLENVARATTKVGKAQEAQQTREYLLNLASNNPFSLETITDSFVKLRTGGLEPTNGALQTLMDSVAAFGGGSANLERASVAIQQMGGKGVISMEELRQQLGEHIPDATKAMAAGMGLALKDLYKQIELGNVESTNALNKMMAVLELKHRGSAAKMMNTWDGLMARMGTAWQRFVAGITGDKDNPSQFIITLKKNVQDLMAFLNSAEGRNFGISVSNGLAAVADVFVTLIKLAYEWRAEITTAAKVFAVYWSGKLIVGTILSLIGLFMKLGAAVRFVTTALLPLRAAMAVAGVAAAVAGTKITAMQRATMMLAAAGRGGVAAMAALAARFSAVGLAAAAAAGAIWLVVTALRAQTSAQIAKNNAQHAAQGGGFEEGKRDDEERWLQRSKSELSGAKKLGNGKIKLGNNTIVSEAEYNRRLNIHNSRFNSYKEMVGNAQRGAASAREANFVSKYGAKYEDLKSTLSLNYGNAVDKAPDNMKQAVSRKGQQESVKLAQNAIGIWRKRAEATNDPVERKALDSLIKGAEADLAQWQGHADSLGSPNAYTDDGKGPKNSKGGGDKVDPLQKYRDQFVNQFVNSAELEHQYNNLRNGTDSPFDSEAASEAGEKAVMKLQQTEEALQAARRAQQDYQEELKKTIKNEEAIIEIRDSTIDLNTQTKIGFDALDRGYESITANSQAFRESLEREHRAELIITEARRLNATATADEIRQYEELRRSIDDAVRAKEAEMLLELSRKARDDNEAYKKSNMTPRQAANYEANIERSEYADALGKAKKRLDTAPAEIEIATQKYNDAVYAFEQAKATMTQAEQKEAGDDIEVLAKRKRELEQSEDLAKRAIPYLEERLRILREEDKIRNKWGGMAGPIVDWAKGAAAQFDDLGGSMGNVMAGAMDNFINSLAEGKMAFKDFAKTVLKQLLLIILRGLIAKAIMSALGLGFGGGSSVDGAIGSGELSFGSNIGSYGDFAPTGGGHGGMIAGGGARFHRSVDAGMFNFAQRYHTGGIIGLRDNEVPIIAEKGEGVFTKEQMQAMGGASKPNNVEINVINQTGVDAEVQRVPPKFDGEKWVEGIILKKLGTAGPIRDALSGRR